MFAEFRGGAHRFGPPLNMPMATGPWLQNGWQYVSLVLQTRIVCMCGLSINNNNHNNNNSIPSKCLWCCHHGRAIARVHPVHLINVERRQVAADPRPSQMT